MARACPRDYVAAGLIGAASAWIGNARRIAATAAWNEPANLWFALVGAPSAGKMPALHPIIEASRGLERDAEPGWRAALAKYERDAEVANAVDKRWRLAVHAAVNEDDAPPNRPPEAEAPIKPARPRAMAMNSTSQKLQRLLAENPRAPCRCSLNR